jgi:hypothetical protein
MLAPIIEMKLPIRKDEEPMFLTGRTLLLIARVRGQVLFDIHGTPILADEYYKVSSDGIERID